MSATATPQPQMRGRVLVVDPDATTALESAKRLEAAGFTVVAAGTAMRALRALEIDAFDAIFCEMRMPRMDGFELRDAILGDEASAKIPFFFLSNDATAEEIATAERLRVRHVISKPIPPAAMRALDPQTAKAPAVLVPPPPPEIQEIDIGDLVPVEEPVPESSLGLQCSICAKFYRVPAVVDDTRLFSTCPSCLEPQG